MIELHQFRPFRGLPNASPFCMKAETYLRFRGIPYKVVLDALAGLLGDQPYFLGAKPRSLDTSLYAFLANILDQPHGNPLQSHGRALANLVGYRARMNHCAGRVGRIDRHAFLPKKQPIGEKCYDNLIPQHHHAWLWLCCPAADEQFRSNKGQNQNPFVIDHGCGLTDMKLIVGLALQSENRDAAATLSCTYKTTQH